jgi:zinc transporter ZupT
MISVDKIFLFQLIWNSLFAEVARNEDDKQKMSIGCVHWMVPSFILNISTVLNFWPKQLFSFVEMVSMACNNMTYAPKNIQEFIYEGKSSQHWLPNRLNYPQFMLKSLFISVKVILYNQVHDIP